MRTCLKCGYDCIDQDESTCRGCGDPWPFTPGPGSGKKRHKPGERITNDITHPMDGEWVERAAHQYLARYFGGSASDKSLEAIQVTNCIRESLPHVARMDDTAPQCIHDLRELAGIREYLWPNQTGLPNEHRNALVAIKAREKLAAKNLDAMMTEKGLADARLEAFKRIYKEKLENAEKMRGEALLALGTMQDERNALDAHIARESRISDSEMMALLRRRAKVADELELEIANLRNNFAVACTEEDRSTIARQTSELTTLRAQLRRMEEALRDARVMACEGYTASAGHEQSLCEIGDFITKALTPASKEAEG